MCFFEERFERSGAEVGFGADFDMFVNFSHALQDSFWVWKLGTFIKAYF